MKTLYESILGNTKDRVKSVSDDVQKDIIYDKLINSGWYEFGFRGKTPTEIFKIYKKHGKWTVDVNGPMTCYGTEDGGITDGTFRFGVIDSNFTLSSPPSDSRKCQVKSLKYGPSDVKGSFYIWDSEYLKDLRDCPKYVHESVIISYTPITTLKYFPIYVGRNVLIEENKNLKRVDDTKLCKIMGTSVEIRRNGFVTTERTYNDINWEIVGGFKCFRYDKSIASPEFN